MSKSKEMLQCDNISKICRICLLEQSNMLYLFNRNYTDSMIVNILITTFNLEFIEDNNLPDKICTTCFKLVKTFRSFKEECEESERILKYHTADLNVVMTNECDSEIVTEPILPENCEPHLVQPALENTDSVTSNSKETMSTEDEDCAIIEVPHEIIEINDVDIPVDNSINNEAAFVDNSSNKTESYTSGSQIKESGLTLEPNIETPVVHNIKQTPYDKFLLNIYETSIMSRKVANQSEIQTENNTTHPAVDFVPVPNYTRNSRTSFTNKISYKERVQIKKSSWVVCNKCQRKRHKHQFGKQNKDVCVFCKAKTVKDNLEVRNQYSDDAQKNQFVCNCGVSCDSLKRLRRHRNKVCWLNPVVCHENGEEQMDQI